MDLHPSPTLRDLARLLAAWLVVILLVQGFAAAQGVVQGPRHRHLPASTVAASSVRTVVALALSHPELHSHHDEWQRHVHLDVDASSVTVPDDRQEAGTIAAVALAALVGLPAQSFALPIAASLHVLQAARRWVGTSAWEALPERPPRR